MSALLCTEGTDIDMRPTSARKLPHLQDTETGCRERGLRLCQQGVVILPQDLLPIWCVYEIH